MRRRPRLIAHVCALALALPAARAERPGPTTASTAPPALQLELGRWTVAELDRLIRTARIEHPEVGARVAHFVARFRGTPFEYESLSPPPPPGTLRVRLDRFGCTGFVITMLALATAHDFTSFTQQLARIRYWRPGAPSAPLDSDPDTGNLLDFAYEVFVDSAVGQGFATDVTAAVARHVEPVPFRARFTARRRGLSYDPERRLVAPRVHPAAVVTAHMITAPDLARMDRSRIRTGDLLLFTRVAPGRTEPPSEELLVGHAAIAVRIDGEVYMAHATRDFLWRPSADRTTPPSATGVYYGDPRREQLGVAMATRWVADPRGQELRIGDDVYHGYDRWELRPVHEYMAGAKFRGVMVLRPAQP